MNSIVRSAKFWFVLSLCALVPLQIWFVVSSPWFARPPKPIGDGPDYENIAFHLSQGRGWSMGWSDPEWRRPYLDASLSQLDAELAQQMPADRIPIADYSVQLQRHGPTAATTTRPPLFPTLIASVYCLIPRGPAAFAAVRLGLAIALAVAGSLAVAMSAACMRMMTSNSLTIGMAAIVSLILAALDRTIRNYATDFLTEPIAMLLMQLWILSLWHLLVPKVRDEHLGQRKSSVWRSPSMAIAICGSLLALLITARSLFVLWVPGIWLLMLIPTRYWRLPTDSQPAEDLPSDTPSFEEDTPSFETMVHPGWRALHRATMVMLMCLVIMSPWWIRNCIVLQAAMPLGTQGPITLLGGYHDLAIEARGEWQPAPELQLRQSLSETNPPGTASQVVEHEVQVARMASRRVAHWIGSHKRMLPLLAWLRVQTEWSPYTGRSLLWKVAAIIGLLTVATRLPPAAFLTGGVLLISTLTVAAVYSVGGRFLVPNYGSLYTLAGIGVAAMYETFASTIWRGRLSRVA